MAKTVLTREILLNFLPPIISSLLAKEKRALSLFFQMGNKNKANLQKFNLSTPDCCVRILHLVLVAAAPWRASPLVSCSALSWHRTLSAGSAQHQRVMGLREEH